MGIGQYVCMYVCIWQLSVIFSPMDGAGTVIVMESKQHVWLSLSSFYFSLACKDSNVHHFKCSAVDLIEIGHNFDQKRGKVEK